MNSKPSIHDLLAQPNPGLDSSSISWGQNTYNQDWIPVSDWVQWRDFTLKNLTSMYADILSARLEGPPSIDVVSSFDQQIRDEKSMDYFLVKFVWPSVNRALERATSRLKWGSNSAYLGPGSWCYGTGSPDWGLVSNRNIESGGKFWNLLPGDTKLSAKWNPEMRLSGNENVRYQWSLPLSQVSTYAAESGCRYGFLITDGALIVLRFRKQLIGEGLAAMKPSRVVPAQTQRRVVSNETELSSTLESMSLGSFGAQSYDDHDLADAANVELQPPEYAVIPMSNHGRNVLTVKFSIFCLCLMAAGGCSTVDYNYPPLDSWRCLDDHDFIHNTSNFRVGKLPRKAILCNPQEGEQEETRPEMSADDDVMEDGQLEPSEETTESLIYEEMYEARLPVERDGHRASSSRTGSEQQPHKVVVKKKDGRLCFRDAKGELRKTKRKEWTRVSSGWIFYGKKNSYFAEHLPED